MASQRQAHNRKRQKAILVMAVALLIIVVIAIIGLTTFLKKCSDRLIIKKKRIGLIE